MKENSIFVLIFILIFSCYEKNKTSQIIVNDEDEEQFVKFDDSSNDVYNFHENKKLYYYVNIKNREIENEGVYFYSNGRLKSKSNFHKGKKNGYHYQFYHSGLLFRSEFFRNDTIYGYGVEYYNSLNRIKSDFFYDGTGGYIYKRDYDSLSQKIINIHDDRLKYLQIHPNLNPIDIKLPWEDINWHK